MEEDKLIESAKKTVGYNEAENKESFMVGVSVGFGKAKDEYLKQICDIISERDSWMRWYKEVKNDITILSNIINKYN